MPDDRSSGFMGGSAFVRFNQSDNASRIPDKKRSKDENQSQESDDDQNDNKSGKSLRQSEFVDRSAQLRATLNSLAMLNAANVLKDKNNHKNSQAIKSIDVKKD